MFTIGRDQRAREQARATIRHLQERVERLRGQARDQAELRAMVLTRPFKARCSFGLGKSAETKKLRETFNAFLAEEEERRGAEIGYLLRKIERTARMVGLNHY
jgi:hypothetical protein